MPLSISKNRSLAELTWWKVGGAAEWFCEPASFDELCEALTFAKVNKIGVEIIGGGSNVLVSDQGVEGLVISTRALSDLRVEENENRLEMVALCGTPKSQLLKVFLEKKLMPAVFLTGLPGDVAGGVVMNAGVGNQITPREFGELVDWVEVIRESSQKTRTENQFERVVIPKQQLEFSYRNSIGWQPGIIFRVGLSWPLDADPEVMMLVRKANKSRLMSQPLNLPSCGSVFRNPLPQKAGQLIESVGLKGYQLGGAQISEKHANFIVNRGEAQASDIIGLIELIQEKVLEVYQIQLETEVRWIGRK